jgi:hypothetical protein
MTPIQLQAPAVSDTGLKDIFGGLQKQFNLFNHDLADYARVESQKLHTKAEAELI